MSKFCANCGNELHDEAVVCVKCGCPASDTLANQGTAVPQKKTPIAWIFGLVGIIFSMLFALIGHAASITGIVFGIKEYKETKNVLGLVLSIIGEVLSVISSVIGIVSSFVILFYGM